ncbi:Transketolase 1 [Austwickia sp. TVS 96-490-7B]|uniref:transketolase-like TK C-terminal-containing protein n=1 Tax=Austwickia sp. TVS 96-490-7B TaxID=2830843 RepID=UPI001D39C404|nr:Transketolase 1 [Austwickia sp. TVS 96-490-7B]
MHQLRDITPATTPPLDIAAATHRGGYVVTGPADADLIIIATGTEVALAVHAADRLGDSGHTVRVVSMPCREWFDSQPTDYRHHVLPPTITRRIAIEAGRSDSWWKYVGSHGRVLGVDDFGTSGPGPQVMARAGIDVDTLVATARELVATPLPRP